jgi:hypothetical protein
LRPGRKRFRNSKLGNIRAFKAGAAEDDTVENAIFEKDAELI